MTEPQKAAIEHVGEAAARQDVVETALTMSRRGLSPRRSGNVSRRWRDGMLITPTGMPYDSILPSDIVFVDSVGGSSAASRKPSSEWQFHLASYKARPDMAAIVHTHSMHATVLACANRAIPAFHYMVAAAGGVDIPCVPYALFGSEQLARNVAKGLRKRDACLMANHGMIALGNSCTAALDLAAEVETLAEQYVKLLAIGKPVILSDDDMAEVLARFATYGQHRK